MKKLIIRCLTFVGLALLMLLPPQIHHDVKLKAFSEQLFSHTMPDGARLEAAYSVCGKLNGNGDGMDFLACVVITSDKSLDEIISYFENSEFRPVYADSAHTVELEVKTVRGSLIKSRYLERQTITLENPGFSDPERQRCAIIIYDGGYGAKFDFRGCKSFDSECRMG